MRYIIGVFGAILLLLVVVVLIFNRGDSSQPSATVQPAQLVDYATRNSNVSFTTVGRVVGEDQQRSIRVVVSPSERRLEIMSGYGQTVLSSQTFANTAVGYQNFLSALGGQGFTRARSTSIKDATTVCPTGQRFEYDLSENGEHVSNLWSVSCDRSGSFGGSAVVVRQLFERQIPDYSKLVTDVDL